MGLAGLIDLQRVWGWRVSWSCKVYEGGWFGGPVRTMGLIDLEVL